MSQCSAPSKSNYKYENKREYLELYIELYYACWARVRRAGCGECGRSRALTFYNINIELFLRALARRPLRPGSKIIQYFIIMEERNMGKKIHFIMFMNHYL